MRTPVHDGGGLGGMNRPAPPVGARNGMPKNAAAPSRAVPCTTSAAVFRVGAPLAAGSDSARAIPRVITARPVPASPMVTVLLLMMGMSTPVTSEVYRLYCELSYFCGNTYQPVQLVEIINEYDWETTASPWLAMAANIYFLRETWCSMSRTRIIGCPGLRRRPGRRMWPSDIWRSRTPRAASSSRVTCRLPVLLRSTSLP